MYDRVSTAAACRIQMPHMAEIFRNYMWKGWLCPASPVLSNMGTRRGLPISCFGLSVPDSINGIYKKLHEMAMLSKSGGGVGINFNHVRPRGMQIKDNGNSSGFRPWAEVYNKAISATNQGDTRGGAASLNINIKHGDFYEYTKIFNV